MPLLQRLRQALLATRALLVWFVLSLGVAVASPMVHPQAIELLCTGTGVMKVLVKNADGSAVEEASRMLDCPLCVTVGAPPPRVQTPPGPNHRPGLAVQSVRRGHTAARAAAPLPARGPPAFS